jgi:hypothetical protein
MIFPQLSNYYENNGSARMAAQPLLPDAAFRE